jgi:steroid delta-isomerase-like uncharacterized protein
MDTPANTGTPSQIAREAFRILFDERDLSDPTRLWSENSVDHFLAAGRSVRGATALAQWFGELFAAMPDFRMEIVNAFDDGDRQATVQWRSTGTFTGSPFLGIEANGKRLEIDGVDVIRFDSDGKIDENTIYYDGAEFARQLGMLPARDTPADRMTLAAFNAKTRVERRLRGGDASAG